MFLAPFAQVRTCELQTRSGHSICQTRRSITSRLSCLSLGCDGAMCGVFLSVSLGCCVGFWFSLRRVSADKPRIKQGLHHSGYSAREAAARDMKLRMHSYLGARVWAEELVRGRSPEAVNS